VNIDFFMRHYLAYHRF